MGTDRAAIPARAAEALGDEPALRLLQELVAIAPTNLEDLAQGRFEKPNYGRAAEAIVRAARTRGLATRLYDPIADPDSEGEYRGIPRPNVIVDLDRGAPARVLILAHFDVVPIPAEQRARWASPPHALTQRSDGRLYGRGANDDLGSGIVASLLAMGRLSENPDLPRNVRLLACCDEETGGAGGIEALLEHDRRLPEGDPGRFVTGDVALIPDGGTHTTVGSSGVAFLEATYPAPVPLGVGIALGESLVGLDAVARGWRSPLPSPDWPDRGAPEPVITGRASVTRFDVTATSPGSGVGLARAHAETDAGNQIARVVTLVFSGPEEALGQLAGRLAPWITAPFRLEPAGPSAVERRPGTLALQVVGTAAHGGYPHRGHNPVPAALRLLEAASGAGIVDAQGLGRVTYTTDLRLPPEMELETGLSAAFADLGARLPKGPVAPSIVAPPERCRPGYALPPDHPAARRLDRILREELAANGTFGEYGGTDASSLREVRSRDGTPLPALVFGSMDDQANIHDAEESVDPRTLAGVARAIERFVRDP